MTTKTATEFEHRSLSPLNATWAIITVALALASHLRHLPIWISVLSVLLLLTRYLLLFRRPVRSLKLLLGVTAVASISGVMLQYGTLVGRDAGVALLALMLSLKVMEMKQIRDAMLAIFLSYFLVMTSFFFSQGILVSLYGFSVVVLITGALSALNEGKQTTSLAYKLKASAGMFAYAIPIMLLLFVLFPRLPGPLWAMPQNRHSGITGLGDEMTPGNISQLIQSDAVAFRVTFDNTPPPARDRYWRGPVMSSYNGRSWRMVRSGILTDTEQFLSSRDLFNYRITLEANNKSWLFALGLPVTHPQGTAINTDFMLLSKKPIDKKFRYEIESSLDYIIDEELTSKSRAQNLQLPAKTATRTRRLVNEWRGSAQSNSDIVNQALQYFNSNPFVYTLKPPLLKKDPVDQFMFETRRGFCEHYASSFVVMMRAAGIPARVVTGYQGGEWNRLGNYILVRQSDAHAWAEVWLTGKGWVRVDPTAAVSPDRVELGISNALGDEENLPFFVRAGYSNSIVNRLSLLWDSANYRWDTWVLGFGPEQQRALLSRLGLDNPGWRHLIYGMIIGLVSLLSLYALLFAWHYRNARIDPLVKLFHQFSAKMTRQGIPPQPYEGAIDYGRRVSKTRPELALPVQRITQLYSHLRYGKPCGPGPADLQLLKKLVRALQI